MQRFLTASWCFFVIQKDNEGRLQTIPVSFALIFLFAFLVFIRQLCKLVQVILCDQLKQNHYYPKNAQ